MEPHTAPLQKTEQALDEISLTLEQMLALAEISAADLEIDRGALQTTVEHLKRKIDRIADRI